MRHHLSVRLHFHTLLIVLQVRDQAGAVGERAAEVLVVAGVAQGVEEDQVIGVQPRTKRSRRTFRIDGGLTSFEFEF